MLGLFPAFLPVAPEPEVVDILVMHPQHGQRSIDIRAWKDYEPKGWKRVASMIASSSPIQPASPMRPLKALKHGRA